VNGCALSIGLHLQDPHLHRREPLAVQAANEKKKYCALSLS
jgi:hypothetical protein